MQCPYLQIITYIVYRSKQEKSKCFKWPRKEPWPWPWSAYLLADRQSGNTQTLRGLWSVRPQTALGEKVNGAACPAVEGAHVRPFAPNQFPVFLFCKTRFSNVRANLELPLSKCVQAVRSTQDIHYWSLYHYYHIVV